MASPTWFRLISPTNPTFFCILSTIGQKIEWMRVNPKVCIEMDEIASESQWVSVIVNGHYQELPEPQLADERGHARKLLEKRYLWWQNALGERSSSRARS